MKSIFSYVTIKKNYHCYIIMFLIYLLAKKLVVLQVVWFGQGSQEFPVFKIKIIKKKNKKKPKKQSRYIIICIGN